MLKEFIEKSIETESGFNASCWVVTGIWLDIKSNKGVITLDGYKDFEAKEAGKTVMGTKQVTIPDISVIPCYNTVKTDIVNTVFASDEFSGATLQSREVAEPEQETETGE